MSTLENKDTNAGGVGVWGECQDGRGVVGVSGPNGAGVWGHTKKGRGVVGVDDQDGVGVWGESPNGDGVVGATGTSAKNGIVGRNDQTDPAPALIDLGGMRAEPGGHGVFGFSMVPNACGVFGANNNGGDGVAGRSTEGDGVVGSTDTSAKNGIFGRNDGTEPAPRGKPVGNGVFGLSMVPKASGVFGLNDNGTGVAGRSSKGFGVAGFSEINNGVFGKSTKGFGVHGHSRDHIGVYAVSDNDTGVFGKGPYRAGYFEGDVEVTGDIQLTNGDCAEDFTIGANLSVEPGTVMVLGDEGVLYPSRKAYDKRVAGVVSGAGDYKPAIVLDRQKTDGNRQPIALLGKVYCKVDAQYGAIEVGDLLTTSDTPGHAMKVSDPINALGSVIGKALRAMPHGRGLVLILIALQ
jgi:hypothetical protein